VSDATLLAGAAMLAVALLAAALAWALLTLARARREAAHEKQERLASESRWNRLLESAGAGVWEWDVQTEQARYSSRWKAMLGYADDEISGSAEEWLDRLHPEDAPRARREFGALVSGRSPAYLTQYRLRCKDGSYKWIEDFGIAVSHGADGRPDRLVGTHTDATRSRHAEEKLRQSEALYRAMFDSNPEPLWVYDLETLKFLAVNQVALDRYGYTREEFLQLTMLDVRPPEEWPRIREWVKHVVAQTPGFISAGHWVHRRHNGEVFKVDVLGNRIQFDGRPAGLTMARDLTVQLQAERTLRESEDTLRAIFEQAGVGVALTDSHTLQLRRTNRKYNELLGYTAAEAITPVDVKALTHPDDIAADLMQMERLKRGEIRSFAMAKRLRRRDGSYIWAQVTISPMWSPGEEVTSHIAVIENITERIQAEAQRQALAERLDIATRIAGIGVFEWDLVAGTRESNAKSLEILGISRERFERERGDPANLGLANTHEDDHARVIEFYRRLLAGPTSQGSMVCRIRRPDGAVRDVQFYLSMHRNADGRAVRAVGALADVTDRLRYEQSERGRLAAEVASQAKTEFLSRMSHELRTPLNAMLGFTQLMLRNQREPLSAGHRETMGNIERAGWHLLDMISEMLDLARIESGRLVLNMTSVPLHDEVRECMALLAPMANQHQVALEFTPPATRPLWVRADITRLRQVLANLLSNAIKYNRPAGSVRISIGREAASTHGSAASGPAQAGEGRVWLRVRDEGMGIDAEQAAHLFEPFNRLGAEHSKVEGLGIGLVITRSLIERMHGQLTLDSEPGRGSEFTVTLDEAPQPGADVLSDGGDGAGGSGGSDKGGPVGPADTPEAARPPGHTACVLYIEDNPSNVALVRGIFELRPSLSLLVANDGLSGLAIARERRPDLVLLDLSLPDIDGLEVFERLRRDPLTASMRCVALSADATAARIEEIRAKGFTDYWTKPIDVARFLTDLDRLLADPTRAAR
jgi:PAS domain S-box-containing protein